MMCKAFSREQDVKGTIEPGKYADFAILSEDYFAVPDEAVKNITSVMTVMGGKLFYADAEDKPYGPPELPASPDGSPIGELGGYYHADHNHPAHAPYALASGSGSQGPHSVHNIHWHSHLHTVFSENGHWNMNCPCYMG